MDHISETLVDLSKLTVKVSLKDSGGACDYRTGTANALRDIKILQAVRMRRRQLGQMMRAYDVQSARHRLPETEYFISRKIDGEFTCLVYQEGSVITLNPGGTIRLGAPFHQEAAILLKKAGIKNALIGGELYVRREDGARARVHDVARVARAPANADDVGTLCFAVFNIYDLDGEDPSANYMQAMQRATQLFEDGDLITPVEALSGDKKQVFEQFKLWVTDEGAEGVVVRSDSAGIYKIKPRHNIDLAVIGFSAGIDDRAGMLHSLLVAMIRSDGSFQIIGRVGGGFTDEQRTEILKTLQPEVVETDYAEVNSDRVAYQMIAPGRVVEITCLDIIAQTSHGSSIDRMVLEWNSQTKTWEGVRRLPLCSILSPQYVRLRDDKKATADDVQFSQLTDIVSIDDAGRSAQDLKLPASETLERIIAVKTLKGAQMVRKLMAWKTNKSETSSDFPAFVLHLTDFSPNRKAPLKHEIRVSSSEQQIQSLLEAWKKKYFVRGWKVLE